jgi:hypothetical protein
VRKNRRTKEQKYKKPGVKLKKKRGGFFIFLLPAPEEFYPPISTFSLISLLFSLPFYGPCRMSYAFPPFRFKFITNL